MADDTERELRWRNIIASCERALRAYLRTTHADEQAVVEMYWDVWAAAVEDEAELLATDEPWPILHKLARRIARDWVWRSRHVELRDSHQEVRFPSLAAAPDLGDENATESAVLHWQSAALATLSERQRAIVDLRYRYSAPDDLVAELLGISETTLRVHAMRGLARLRSYAASHPPPRIYKG